MELITNQHFSCHQILLATYASYRKYGYEMIFAESWGFNYDKDEQILGSSLHPGYQNRRKELLEKFHGIKVKEVSYLNRMHLIDLAQSILPHNPIILYHNAYDCPWSISYRKNRIDHYIMINGINENNNYLHVLDPFITKEENLLDVNNVQKNGIIHTFEIIEAGEIQKKDYYFEILNNLNHINNSNFFDNLMNFKNNFQNRFEAMLMLEYSDIYAIPLVFNLERISHQRHCFCVFLRNMLEKDLVDFSIIDFMEKIAEKYALLRIIIIKQIIKQKINKGVFELINEIINDEYEVYKKLKKFV